MGKGGKLGGCKRAVVVNCSNGRMAVVVNWQGGGWVGLWNKRGGGCKRGDVNGGMCKQGGKREGDVSREENGGNREGVNGVYKTKL